MTTKLRRKIGFTLVLIWFAVLITWMLSLSQVAVSTGLRVYGSQDHITNQSTVIRVVGLDTKANYPVAISDVQYRWITPTQTSIWTLIGIYRAACMANRMYSTIRTRHCNARSARTDSRRPCYRSNQARNTTKWLN